jgi:hypothetical protein
MEKRNSVDQRRATVAKFFCEFEDDLVGQGSIVTTFRQRSGRRLGPYFKLVCRHAGRQRAVYLGNDPGLVEEVRRRLELLQEATHRRRVLDACCRAVHMQARTAQRQLRMELAKRGLILKGHEVRGRQRIQ